MNQKVSFFSASMGSPAASTLARSLANGWVKFPELTATMVRNQPHSEATSRGHLDRTRSGLDSTRETTHISPAERMTSPGVEEPRHTIFVDLTGRFPHVSARGTEYLLCCRCSDSNYIHAETLRSRSSKEITSAFERAVKFFGDRGIRHQRARMDNEVSSFFKETVRAMGIQLELVPPDNHRTNPAERDIRTLKNHLVATLATTDPDFPINEWDHILPQVEMTLNMMRGSRTGEGSAYQHIRGNYDFSRNPIAPVGTRVIILEDASRRGSWAPHGVRGFYLGPAMDHYRSFRVLTDDTRRVRITDSLSWHPREEHNFADIRSQMQNSHREEDGSRDEPPRSIVPPTSPLVSHSEHSSFSPPHQATPESVTTSPLTPLEGSLTETPHNSNTDGALRELSGLTIPSQSDSFEALSQATTFNPRGKGAPRPKHPDESVNARYSQGLFKFGGCKVIQVRLQGCRQPMRNLTDWSMRLKR